MRYILLLLVLMVSNLQCEGQTGRIERGRASYYADKFNGRKTASGEIFSNNKMTAAHRTLRFGTMVKVTNTSNDKSVIVRINDRGPYAHNRIIDLSKLGAQKLDMIRHGTANVIVEIIGSDGKVTKKPKPSISVDTPYDPTPVDPIPEKKPEMKSDKFYTGKSYSMWGTQKYPKGYGIQLGSYSNISNAKDLCKSVIEAGFEDVYIQVGWNNKRVYRVLVGAFSSKKEGKSALKDLRSAGFSGFIKTHFK